MNPEYPDTCHEDRHDSSDQLNQLLIRGKDSRKNARKGNRADTGNGSHCKCEGNGKLIGFSDSFEFAGAEIVADDRLDTLGKALDGNDHKLHHTLKNCHRAHI